MLVLSPLFIEFKETVLKEGDTGKIQDCMTGIVFLLLIQLFVIFFQILILYIFMYGLQY